MTDGSERDGRRWGVVVAVVAVAGVMMALAGVAVFRLALDNSEEPENIETVQSIAERSVQTTEDLDILAGVALLCETPIDLYRMAVESTIVRWQGLTGSDAPRLAASVSDVDAGSSGSFVLTIEGDEDGIDDVEQVFRVFVERQDGRACVTGVGDAASERQTTRFAGGGYSRVTTPTPTPTPDPDLEQGATP